MTEGTCDPTAVRRWTCVAGSTITKSEVAEKFALQHRFKRGKQSGWRAVANRDCNSLIEERFSAWQSIGLKLGFHSPADELRKAQIPAQSCLSGRGGKVSSRARLRRQRSQEHFTRRGSTWPHVGHMYSPRKLFVIFWKLNPAIMQ
jgi:hypothetical protein